MGGGLLQCFFGIGQFLFGVGFALFGLLLDGRNLLLGHCLGGGGEGLGFVGLFLLRGGFGGFGLLGHLGGLLRGGFGGFLGVLGGLFFFGSVCVFGGLLGFVGGGFQLGGGVFQRLLHGGGVLLGGGLVEGFGGFIEGGLGVIGLGFLGVFFDFRNFYFCQLRGSGGELLGVHRRGGVIGQRVF